MKENFLLNKFAYSLVIILFFLAISFAFSKSDLYQRDFKVEPTKGYESGWVLMNDDGTTKPITFPLKLEIKQGESKTIAHLVDDKLITYIDPAIQLYSYYYNVVVKVDDNKIFESISSDQGISNTNGTGDIVIPVSHDDFNKMIEFEIIGTINGDFTYNIPSPLIGERNDLYFDMVKGFNILNVLNIFLITLGAIIIIVSLVNNKLGNFNNLSSVGFFALLGGLYLLFSSRWIHNVIPNTYLVYLVEYSLFMTMTWPILAGVINISKGYIKKVASLNLQYGITLFIFSYISLFFFKIEFVKILGFAQLELLISIVIVAILAIQSYRKNYTVGIKFSVSFIPLSIGVIIDICLYYLIRSTDFLTFFSQIGILVYIVFQVTYAYEEYERDRKENLRVEIYRRLAFNDTLTGVKSRVAYSANLDTINDNISEYKNLWSVCLDVNNLKTINDSYGHAAGDELLKGVAMILTSSISETDIFRTGGDEFIIFLHDYSDQDVEDYKTKLEGIREEYNNKNNVNISFAIGFSKYDSKIDNDFEDTINRADSTMYENKKLRKQNK